MKFNGLPENADVMTQVCPRLDDANVIARVKAWRKIPSASMIYILVLGAGGKGSDCVSVTNGGGGGGGGGQTSLLIPAILVPDTLYVSEFANTHASSLLMGVFVHPRATTLALWRSACVAYASFGGNGSGATAGAAGAVATAANMPRGFGGIKTVLAGQAGGAGGAAGVAAANLAFPTTGLLGTGGGGGGGWVTASQRAGGGITASGIRPGVLGGLLGSNPPGRGYDYVGSVLLPCGGGGGSSSDSSATYTQGETGGIGSGGGGAGSRGATLTALGGDGGPGLIVIAQW